MNIQRRPGALITIGIIKNLSDILKDKLEISQKIKNIEMENQRENILLRQ